MTRKTLLLSVAAAALALAVTPPAISANMAVSGQAAPDTLDAIGDAYTALGGDGDGDQGASDKGVSAKWPDVSPAASVRRKQALENLLGRLRRLPPPADHEDRLSRAFLEYQIGIQLKEFDFDEARIPFSNGQGFFRQPASAANSVLIRNRQDAENWLTRMADLPEYYAENIANMRRGLKDGFVRPRVIVDQVLEPMRTAATLPVADDPMLKPLDHLPRSIPDADQQALRDRAVELIRTRVRPAQQALVTFMEQEYRPKASAAIGVSDLPDGRAYYRYLIRKFTTTDMTPEQIHALGEKEVAKIRGEMETLIRSTGFAGTVAQFNDALRADPANYADSPESYMEKTSEVAKRADRALPRWFGKLPRLTWGPAFKRPDQEGTANVYMRGSLANGVPGSAMISRRDATKTPLYQMTAWIVHEGVPGHHLQISLAQENGMIPLYRRNAHVTPFIEGWALYAEGLSEEMGLYRTAKERYGRLSFEMYRACRLVMDTGIHWMHWTRDQARQCLAENTALSPANVDFETNRYISQPGQALAYKIGEQRILGIRARAESTLGPAFDIRVFHDALLGEGALPLDLLDSYMNDWIAKAAAQGTVSSRSDG